MIRVFLCVMDVDFLKDMINLNHEDDIEIVGFSIMIPKNLDVLVELKVDAIVVRDAIDVQRANALMEKIRNIPIYQNIHMIHIFKEIDGCTFHTLTQSCIINYLLEPYTAKEVLAKVKEEVEKGIHKQDIAKYIEEIGSHILMEHGVPENLKGYGYLKKAAFIMIQNSSKIAMNQVYKEIASMEKTTMDCVEKAIRSAIHSGYKLHPNGMMYNGKKPTNGEFLKMMIELLKIRGLLV